VSQREPRLHDPGYLAFLRKRHCLTCGKLPPVDPAHIRMASVLHQKRYVGMAEKPDDRWCVPLCRACHDAQHAIGERVFWSIAGRDPFMHAVLLYKEYGGTGGRPKAPRKLRPRKPKQKRIKIRSREFPKVKRKMRP
jgi:hypothetical protein